MRLYSLSLSFTVHRALSEPQNIPIHTNSPGEEVGTGIARMVVEDLSLSGLVVLDCPATLRIFVAVPAHPLRSLLTFSFGEPASSSRDNKVFLFPASCTTKFAVRIDTEGPSAWHRATPLCFIENPRENALVKKLTSQSGFARNYWEHFGDLLLLSCECDHPWQRAHGVGQRAHMASRQDTEGIEGPQSRNRQGMSSQHYMSSAASEAPLHQPPQTHTSRWACVPVRRGMPVHVVASPFGAFCPDVFANCISQGLVSATFAPAALFFTDARCLPGAAGGAVLVIDEKNAARGGSTRVGGNANADPQTRAADSCPPLLGGLVLGELLRADGSMTEFALVLSSAALHRSLVALLDESARVPGLQGARILLALPPLVLAASGPGTPRAMLTPPPHTGRPTKQSTASGSLNDSDSVHSSSLEEVASIASRCVVMIAAGSMWATGVVVDLCVALLCVCVCGVVYSVV
jgi:hypothetical protein